MKSHWHLTAVELGVRTGFVIFACLDFVENWNGEWSCRLERTSSSWLWSVSVDTLSRRALQRNIAANIATFVFLSFMDPGNGESGQQSNHIQFILKELLYLWIFRVSIKCWWFLSEFYPLLFHSALFALWELSRFNPLLVTMASWGLQLATTTPTIELFPLETHVWYATGATHFNGPPSDVISGSHRSALGVSTADGTDAPWIGWAWMIFSTVYSVVDCFVMWVFPKNNGTPKSMEFSKRSLFSHYFHHRFWGNPPPYFLETSMWSGNQGWWISRCGGPMEGWPWYFGACWGGFLPSWSGDHTKWPFSGQRL